MGKIELKICMGTMCYVMGVGLVMMGWHHFAGGWLL